MTDRRSRTLPLAAVGLAALGVLMFPAVANAQDQPERSERNRGERPGPRGGFGPGGQGGGQWQPIRRPGSFSHLLHPDFQVRDMVIIAQQLELDQSQRPIIEALLVDYRQAFAEAAAELEEAARRVRRRAFGQGLPPGVFGGLDGGGGNVVMMPAESLPIHIELPGRIELSGHEGTTDVEAEHISIAIRVSDSSPTGTAQATPNMIIMGPDGVVIEGDVPPEMQERLEQINERMQQRRERMREWRDREEAREAAGELLDPSEVATIARDFLEKKTTLRERLTDDVELMLTPWQKEQWPAVQQALRRLNLLSQSELSGEQVDLTRVIRDLHLSQNEMRALESILGEYAQEFDAALIRRTEFLNEADVDRFEARHAENWDRLIELADREAQRRISVRTVNDTFTTRVAAALPEGRREEFVATATNRAFPQLAQPTQADRMFRLALTLDSLDPEHRDVIEQLNADHTRQLLALNEKQRQVLRDSEPERPRRMIEMMQEMRRGETQSLRPPRMELFENHRERMALGRTYVNQLRALIPQEVMPELHERENRDDWRGVGEIYRSRQVIQDGDSLRYRREIIIDSNE